MRLKLLFFSTALLLANAGWSQSKVSWNSKGCDTTFYAFNSDWETIDNRVVATYSRESIDMGEYYLILDRYQSGVIQMSAKSLTQSPLVSGRYIGNKYYFFENGDTSSVAKYDSEHRLTGPFVSFYENGQKQSEGVYKKGEMAGTWKYYYENGQLESLDEYSDGIPSGKWTSYYENGQIRESKQYNTDGNLEGSFTEWYDNGQLKQETTLDETGQLQDSILFFHDNGRIWKRTFYKNDLPEGNWKHYHTSGTLAFDCTYRKGMLEGDYFLYNLEQKLAGKKSYVAGKLDGKWVMYDSDGAVLAESEYSNGRQVGEFKEYWSANVLKHSVKYENGEVKKEAWFDRNGKKLSAKGFQSIPTIASAKTLKLALSQQVQIPEAYRCNTWMVISYEVDEEGNTENVTIQETGNDSIDTLMIAAVEKLKWTPGVYFVKPHRYGNEVAIQINGTLIEEVRSGKPYLTAEKDQENKERISRNPTFHIVEEMPEFPGGESALFQFLGQNIRYPAEALDSGIQGITYIQFVVERSGLVTNLKVLRKVDPALDLEGIRVIREMPLWDPGQQAGKPVRVFFKLPIRFTLR